MSRPRKYPEELLEGGVRLALESGRPIAHVAADLGCHPLAGSLGDIPPLEYEQQHAEQEATTLVGATCVTQLTRCCAVPVKAGPAQEQGCRARGSRAGEAARRRKAK